MQEVIDRQIQRQGVTVESIETDDKDKAMEDNMNTMIGGLFHKSKDTNASPTNPSEVPTTNLLTAPPMGSTNLKKPMGSGGTDFADNNKDAGGDADNVKQVWPKLRHHTNV